MSRASIEAERGEGRIVARFSGELDISSADQIQAKLRKLEDEGPTQLVLDLRSLEFIDSTGLRLVLAAHERAEEDGRTLTLVRGPEAVDRVFRIAKLDERLAFVEDPAAEEESAP